MVSWHTDWMCLRFCGVFHGACGCFVLFVSGDIVRERVSRGQCIAYCSSPFIVLWCYLSYSVELRDTKLCCGLGL